jgi:hypothetical protein
MPSILYPPPRPLAIGEVLDSALVIFKITLIRCLPYGLLAVVTGQLQSIYDVATGRPPGSKDFGWGVFFGLGVLISLLLWSAIIVRQKALLDGRPTSLTSDLGAALRALPSMVAALVWASLACAVGLVLLVIPGIYLMLAFAFAGPAILLGGKGPIDALNESRRLVAGNALRVFSIFCVGVSMVLVFDVFMYMLVLVLLQFAGTGDLTVVTSSLPVVVIALGAVTAPFLCALALAMYGDLQVRYAARASMRDAAADAGGERVG